MTNKYLKLFIITITIIGLFSCTTNKKVVEQENVEKVTLRWKVKDTIKYKTIMDQIGDAEFDIDFEKTFGKVFGGISKKLMDSIEPKKDSTKFNLNSFFKGNILKEMKSKLENLNKNTELVTYLTKSKKFDKVIDVEMERKNLSEKDSTKEKGIFSMMGTGVQLKGSIFKDGSIHSFWQNNAQKNLMSLFFELPTKEIKKGDVWQLNYLNYIQYKNIYFCDKAEKKNQVKLIDIITKGKDKIALIEYDISESVTGNMDFIGDKIFSSMKMKYNAKGEFSINKGKWISYKGYLFIETEGMMHTKSKKKFELIEK